MSRHFLFHEDQKNKSDGVKTSDVFWRSACILLSEFSFIRYNFVFSALFCSMLVKIFEFPEIQLMCDLQTDGPTDGQTDGWTYPLIEMGERI